VFDAGESVGMKMDLLDIGGGFPGVESGQESSLDTEISFADIAQVVGPCLDELFPSSVG
jgi:hypothetical protein